MSSFFASLTDKAQSALNSSPLAQHLPSGLTGQGSSASDAQGSGSGGIRKSHTFESIHHQLRTFQQQYSSSTTLVQKLITTTKGVALDYDSVSRDCHARSKELYTWSQQEEMDIRDVTDRLAWINYIEGSLANTLAAKLNASRAPVKALRDAESTLTAHKNIRNGFKTQIGRLERENARSVEARLTELKKQLQAAETEDEPLEKEVELLKRRAITESERQKWAAVKEYAEKLLLLSQAAKAVLPALTGVPPTEKHPYTGGETTANVRAALQHALDNYTAGTTTLQLSPPVDLSRSDTRSFGVTHAEELSSIGSTDSKTQSDIPITPPGATAGGAPPPAPSHHFDVSAPSVSPPTGNQSPPLNPAVLNQAPAPIPIPTSIPSPVVAPSPMDPTAKMPSVTPTVAETGVPQAAGPDGPGPARGSLRDLKSPATGKSPLSSEMRSAEGPPEYVDPSIPSKQKSPVQDAARGPSPKYEAAEEEKKRLEKEERERVLAAGGSGTAGKPPQHPPEDDDPPSYQEF